MLTFPRTSIGLMLAALLATAGVAAAHGPDDRPPPLDVPGPLVGSIEISNERERPVEIFVDGRFAIELRPRTTDTIDRVLNGVRLVSYQGQGGSWQTDRVEVREGRRSSLRIAPLRGRLAIVNRAGVDMRLTLDDTDLGVLRAGRDLTTPPLPPGSHRLSAIPEGWTRVKPQVQEVEIVAGETAHTEIRSFAATLVVSNPFPRRVVAFLDGQRMMKLRGMESVRIPDVQPGRVRVELRDDGRVLAGDTIDLPPGRETYFAPQLVRYGTLEVRNPTSRPVRITLNTSEGFRLEPGGARTIGDLDAGPLTIQVTTDDGRIVKHETDIVAGETQVFQVPRAWLGGGSNDQPVRPPPR